VSPELPSQGGSGGGETILLVEDVEELRELVRRVLESYGYTLLVAADGIEALEFARSHEGEIDLVLTDMMMPRMSGGELVTQLLTARPALGVLFTSGYPAAVLSVHTAGPVAFIQKPYLADELARKVREVLNARASTSSA
jgi:CheY-like chemotaxis protein